MYTSRRYKNRLVAMSEESFGRLRWSLSAVSVALAAAMIVVLEAGR